MKYYIKWKVKLNDKNYDENYEMQFIEFNFN